MTETIAVTIWNNIVSPLYDASCYLLILRSDGERKVVDVKHMSLIDKAEVCSKEGVTVLICGAISNVGHAILQDKNIKVLSWICGAVDEIIAAYRDNVNVTEAFSMPGCGPAFCRKRRNRNRWGFCGMRSKTA